MSITSSSLPHSAHQPRTGTAAPPRRNSSRLMGNQRRRFRLRCKSRWIRSQYRSIGPRARTRPSSRHWSPPSRRSGRRTGGGASARRSGTPTRGTTRGAAAASWRGAASGSASRQGRRGHGPAGPPPPGRGAHDGLACPLPTAGDPPRAARGPPPSPPRSRLRPQLLPPSARGCAMSANTTVVVTRSY